MYLMVYVRHEFFSIHLFDLTFILINGSFVFPRYVVAVMQVARVTPEGGHAGHVTSIFIVLLYFFILLFYF